MSRSERGIYAKTVFPSVVISDFVVFCLFSATKTGGKVATGRGGSGRSEKGFYALSDKKICWCGRL